jgi:hypothetical protein
LTAVPWADVSMTDDEIVRHRPDLLMKRIYSVERFLRPAKRWLMTAARLEYRAPLPSPGAQMARRAASALRFRTGPEQAADSPQKPSPESVPFAEVSSFEVGVARCW